MDQVHWVLIIQLCFGEAQREFREKNLIYSVKLNMSLRIVSLEIYCLHSMALQSLLLLHRYIGAVFASVTEYHLTVMLIFIYGIKTAKWSLQATSIAPGNPRYGHTATTDQSGKLIYYFGGRDIVRDPTTGVYTRPYSTFTNVLIYHTDTSIWEQKTASSTSPPSNRMSHTATLSK